MQGQKKMSIAVKVEIVSKAICVKGNDNNDFCYYCGYEIK